MKQNKIMLLGIGTILFGIACRAMEIGHTMPGLIEAIGIFAPFVGFAVLLVGFFAEE